MPSPSRSAAALLPGRFVSGLLTATALATAAAAQTPTGPPGSTPTVGQVVVTASRVDMLGRALSASQGTVTRTELALRPVFRIGQLLETTPGLIVTVHSGEGKANQYLIRGFNLDHGTDIANFVDGMPVNRPTNTHGQGYSDMNFLMPELAAGLDYTKGPYYASVGDFGAVASTHTRLVDELPAQMSLSTGTLGDQNVFLGGTQRFGPDDRLLAAIDYGHYDGPWVHPDNFHKINADLRYSHGAPDDGYSLTAMYYHGHGNLTTDQPIRAVEEGLIGRFGTLDPSDGSRSERFSLSGDLATHGDAWRFAMNAYYIDSHMTLWNDFTHDLDDPVNGDQEQQDETRNTWGGATSLTLDHDFGFLRTETEFGVQGRYDDAYVDRRHTRRRQALGYCEVEQPPAADGAYVAAVPVAAVDGACQADRVHLGDLGPYAQTTLRFTSWLRATLGAREEYYAAEDHSFISGFQGFQSQTLFQPKASLALGPWWRTEAYLSAGRGFHSDDVRGVFGTVALEGEPAAAGRTPLLAQANGVELGFRSSVIPRTSLQLALFQEDFKSELAYDQDQGQDTASAPSRRQGVELSGQYRPFRWIELNADLATSKARYRGDLAAFGFAQPYIADAPVFIGSLGAIVDNLGPWFGGVQLRDLGRSPLVDGEEYPRDRGFREVNLNVGYHAGRHLTLEAGVYNLTNSRDDASAYFYTSRLRDEPAGGIAGYQSHPLEPISGRLKATYRF